MPVPRQLQARGPRLAITETFRVSVTGHPDKRLYAEASRFIRRLSGKTGIFLDRQGTVGPQDTALTSALMIIVHRPGKLALYDDVSYHLEICAAGIRLNAATVHGPIPGLETILQPVVANKPRYSFIGL